MAKFERFYGMTVRPQLLVLALAVLLAGLPSVSSGSAGLVGYGRDIVEPARTFRLPPHIEHDEQLVESVTPAEANAGVDCRQVSCLALTFDDGPNPLTTPQILSELEQANIHATFFVVGSRIAGNEGLLRRMHSDGDEIGNHSWSHPDMTKLSADQIQQQIQLTQQAVISAGAPPPTVFRPPYGFVSPTMEDTIHLGILMWNEDPKDWAARTPLQVTQAVEASTKPGGIVDLHDIYSATANALPQILANLTARGYHFVTVDDLLDLGPSSRGIYYGYLPQ